ncbi:MAG: nicotinate-nucleotide adenylyltransferase [Clostridia bacterium]|jgi:nicotinate-nucleotide adenylyltransferase|nr:nicotinate (nicotinamide) nucleotide adenylyltransferase [Clostridiaceae bacterium]
MSKRLIAVIGGSFNPVHNGHIAIGEAVERALSPDKILFIPSYIHADKGKAQGASPEDRFFMLQLALEGRSGWEVSDIEYKREETSYTVHTMEKLTKMYENTEFHFVCGADIMYTIHTWREPYRLFQLCKFAVVQRPGYTTEEFLEQVDRVRKEYDGHIKVIECDQLDISSSDIRQRLSRGADVAGMLPERVLEYIKEKGLYKASV